MLMNSSTRIHLIDRLPTATIKAPHGDQEMVQQFTVNRDTRMGIFAHPPSSIQFQELMLGNNPTLFFGMTIKQIVWDRITSPIIFSVTLRDEKKGEHLLLEVALDPKNNPQHQRWVEKTIDLTPFHNQRVSLTFLTSTPPGKGAAYCWAGWSDPILEHSLKTISLRSSHPPKRLVFLLTADALRPDHLGCYGSMAVKTPHLDRLAEEGTLFTHARASSTTTVGSYVSLLTGKHCIEHGCHLEWAMMPNDRFSWPKYMAAHQFHTLFASSECELSLQKIAPHFNNYLPCMGNPAQDGGITTRQVLHWIDHHLHQPTFFWVQYFDAHPPCCIPEPFHSMYYSGDPTDPNNHWEPEKVKSIRGLEILLEFQDAIPQLSEGKINRQFIQRLEDTARYLRKEISCGPDLASHLLGLGQEACLGLSPRRFGSWLYEQCLRCKQGAVPPSLKAWLFEIYPKLQFIEREILSWVDGVVDFRFPLNQYRASVSYFDHHVGSLVKALQERDLYDQTTIIVTAPHGEILNEHSPALHHHALTEQTIRIPMIVKPGRDLVANSHYPHGRRVEGVFDLIDLYPTIIEGLGLPLPKGLSGRSRWHELLTVVPIPEHDSFSDDRGSVLSLFNAPYIYFRDKEKSVNESQLYQVTDSLMYQENLAKSSPEIAASMEARLQAWLQQTERKRGALAFRKSSWKTFLPWNARS